MDRRSFILVTSCGIGFSFTPALCQTPVDAAGAAFAVIGAVSERKFRNETSASLGEIKGLLYQANKKLDEIQTNIRQLPIVIERFTKKIVQEEAINGLMASITAREATIASRVESLQGVMELSLNDRIALTSLIDLQATVRGEIGLRSIFAYPLVVRAFMSEAIALKALGDQPALFDIRKREVVNWLNSISSNMGELGKQRSSIGLENKEKWDKLARPAYLAAYRFYKDTMENYYCSIKGDFRSGVLDFALVRVPSSGGKKNPLFAGTSPFVSYPVKGEDLNKAVKQHVNGYRQAHSEGWEFYVEGPKLINHSEEASKLASAVEQMAY